MLSLTYVGGQRQENNSHHHCNHNHHGRMYEYDTRTTRTTSNSMFSGYGGGCGGVYGTLGVVAVYVDPTRPFFSLVPYVLFSCSSKTLIVQFDQNDHQHHHHYHHGGMNEHDTNTSRLYASEPVVVVVAMAPFFFRLFHSSGVTRVYFFLVCTCDMTSPLSCPWDTDDNIHCRNAAVHRPATRTSWRQLRVSCCTSSFG